MKKIIIIAAAVLLLTAIKTNARELNYNGGYGYFYSSLAPYGSWIELETGLTVWHPRGVRTDWSPYRYGQWAWTNDGWYWDSYEPFGYIVYHYGRWYYDDYYGWIWVPDDVWGPSWVEWRYNNDYIGWAPLPPYASFSVNLGLHFSINFVTPYRHWHFIRYRYICEPNVYRHFAGHRHVHGIFLKTKYKTNYIYKGGRVINRGVDVSYIRNKSGTRIRERNINRVNNPRDLMPGKTGRDGNIRAYIPDRTELSRGGSRDIKILRGDRRSSLETDRMKIGRSDEYGRTNMDRTRNGDVRRENPEMRDNPRIRERTDNRNEIRRESPVDRQREDLRRQEPNSRERMDNKREYGEQDRSVQKENPWLRDNSRINERTDNRNEIRRENPVDRQRENVRRQEPNRRERVDNKRQYREPDRSVRKENNRSSGRKTERKSRPEREPRQRRR